MLVGDLEDLSMRGKMLLSSLLATLSVSGVVFAQDREISFNQHPFLTFDIAEHLTADVTLADLDGDGDLDVLTANGRHWAEQDFVFLNAGSGRMLEARPIGEQIGASYTIQAGDLDKDGDIDAIVVRDNLTALVFENDGDARFSLIGEIAESAGSARSARLLDVDGDSNLDLVMVTRRGTDRLYIGDGEGGFGLPADLPGDGYGSTGVDAGDFDADGDYDLLIARRDGAASVLLINQGSGDFHAIALPASEGDHRKAVFADMNGDERVDIILTGTTGEHLLYEQSEEEEFTEPRLFGRTGDNVQAVAAVDIDADGDIDLVAGADGSNLLYFNNGSGAFQRETLPNSADTYGVAAGDMNGDGVIDLVFANSGTANEVVLTRLSGAS